jgi:hypothetical protein
MRANTATFGALDHAEAIREGKGKSQNQGKPPSRIDGLMAASLTYILWFGLKKIELYAKKSRNYCGTSVGRHSQLIARRSLAARLVNHACECHAAYLRRPKNADHQIT